MKIRDATNADSEEVIDLISSIYDEYGEIMYTDGADTVSYTHLTLPTKA